jgi:DNA-binding CsgD family transcriptional regulator
MSRFGSSSRDGFLERHAARQIFCYTKWAPAANKSHAEDDMSIARANLDPFERLTPRQATCLELTAQLYSAKEIAKLLELEETTVAGYLTEATRLVGARNKRDAARQYLEYRESKHAPKILGGESSRLDARPGELASTALEDKRASGMQLVGEPVTNGADHQSNQFDRFHFLRGERRSNDLTATQRLAWIIIVAVGAAILFTASVSIIDSLQRIISDS